MKSVIGMHFCYVLFLLCYYFNSAPLQHVHPHCSLVLSILLIYPYLLPQRVLRPQLRIPAAQVLLPALLLFSQHPRTTP